MLFVEFAQILSELEQTNSRLLITEKLSQLFIKATPQEIDKTVYLLQGRVVPQYEKLDFNLAEKLVFKALVASFSLNSKVVKQRFEQLGDLGQTVEEYRRSSHSLFESDRPLTLIEVFNKLKDLAQKSGTGSQETKLGILADLFQQLDPLSCRYLVRIILAKLRLGFSDMTVLDSLSWYLQGNKSLRTVIEASYNVRPDLGYVSYLIKKSGTKELEKIKPQPGIPILMARAERASSVEDILKKINPCAIEPKYDGFRLQLHKLENNEVKIYSRNLENVVDMFPDLVKAVKEEVLGSSCIFEAEAVGYNTKTNKILPFQEIVQRKRKYQIEEKIKEIPLKLFAFDLLYYNGQSYLNSTYQKRRKQLEKTIKTQDQVINIATETVVTDTKSITQLFEQAVKDGLEGIMAKKIDGVYRAGARDWNWIKFKHSYSNQLIDTIDCLVMGFDYGKGKRTDFGIGAFLVGVLNAETENYVTVAKIGTGLTDDEWRYLKAKSQNLLVKTKPTIYQVAKQNECDVWLKPGVVVEIRADELSQSPAHTAGLALRFPRLERFRLDKTAQQVSTLAEIRRMQQLQHKSSL